MYSHCTAKLCEEASFQGCENLTSITIPNSVVSIGPAAFNAVCLTSITIPNSVVSIGEEAFLGCSFLQEVLIGSGVTSIDDCTFEECTSLKSLTISNSVTDIGDFAFDCCESLDSVYYKGSREEWNKIEVYSIGEYAYSLIKSNHTSISYYDEDVELGVTYYYKLRVLDSVGNLSDFSETVSARLTDDATPPEIISINPASGSTVGKGYKTVNVYARDNFKVESITIEYKLSEDDEYDILLFEDGLNSEYVNVSAELPSKTNDVNFTSYYSKVSPLCFKYKGAHPFRHIL